MELLKKKLVLTKHFKYRYWNNNDITYKEKL